MIRTLARAAALPVILAALALAPFLDKAFTIDDALFLFQARHAMADPLHPTAFSIAWNEDVPERVSTMMPSGAVAAWLLLPTVAAGGAEWIAHGTVLVLLVLAALATVSLALRLGLAPRWATAAGVLLVTTPAVLGMAGTAMPDVPAMALGVLGAERLLAWSQEGGWWRAIAGAVLLALAALTRSHLAALLVVGPLLLLVADALPGSGRSRQLARLLWPSGLAAAFALGLVIVTRDPGREGGGLLSSAASLSFPVNAIYNGLCLALHWVLTTAFALSWLALRRREVLRRWPVLVGAVAFFAVLRWLQVGASATLWVLPVAGLGVLALADVLLDARARGDALQAVLGLWLLVPLPLVVYAHFPSKYLLASAPAACLLLARLAERRPEIGRWLVPIASALGLLLGVAILRADAAFSDVARSGVRRLAAPVTVAGRTLWYDGSWSFQWYAEQAGARPWNATSEQPRPGDLILTNANRPAPLDEDVYRALVHLQRYEDRTPGGRVMSGDAGAGFFSNAWGYLPWAWGDDLIDAIDLWLAPGGPLPAPAPEPKLIRKLP